MKLEAVGIQEKSVELSRLNDVMKENGLVLAGQWDYERVTYDRKFEFKNEVYYLRVQGYAVEGDVGSRHAMIQLLTPLLGKHYYPHGVEYGEGEKFPKSLIEQCDNLLNNVMKEIDALQ
ncbi:YugN family protein [Cytobacillus sp. IB215665]|uniref:YugN family protein n=1 Tax=Cytobacillus sp. IB215665 TaxID=3097357 RepID=UPI002A12E3CC|nr:YugN family protein [Cytobacillus sp. IB215665]MDX8364936.1 YugN family protein [Cytobacillus sp. IB215665]